MTRKLALAGLVVAVLVAGAASALAQDAGSEVRIAARRLADGRVEFALQPRSGGGWGARVLPSSRYFPANAAVGRWLSSSPVDAGGVEVRISAQRLADGRVEFALQPRAGGGWGERVLPSSRYFPANAAAGRWLSSSPVALGGAAAMTGDDPASCALADHIDRVRAATFQVRTASGAGTAFYIGNDEWLTNHHVVEDATRAELVHGGTRLSAAVAGSLPGYDLALLRARPPSSVRPLRLAAARPAVLASVAVVGFPPPVSGTPSATRGVVSKHAPFSQFPDQLDGSGVVLQTDAEINPGNSGGPIVDGCGTVAAVATFKRSSSQDGRDVDGIGFGVAAETVAARLAQLRSTEHVAGGAPQAAAEAAFNTCMANWGDTYGNQIGATLAAIRTVEDIEDEVTGWGVPTSYITAIYADPSIIPPGGLFVTPGFPLGTDSPGVFRIFGGNFDNLRALIQGATGVAIIRDDSIGFATAATRRETLSVDRFFFRLDIIRETWHYSISPWFAPADQGPLSLDFTAAKNSLEANRLRLVGLQAADRDNWERYCASAAGQTVGPDEHTPR